MNIEICGNSDKNYIINNSLAIDFTPNGELIVWYDENNNTYNIKRKDGMPFDGTEKVGGIFLGNTKRPQKLTDIIKYEVWVLSTIKKECVYDFSWHFNEYNSEIIINPVILNPKLIDYIECNIFPVYGRNDSGHNLDHILYVINRSINFSKEVDDINHNMVYTIAAFHDIGHYIDHKNHEKVSANILRTNEYLKQLFTSEEIEIMAEAIEDHRASLKEDPRSIYGKIVSSADRNVYIEEPLKRTYAYRMKHYPNMSIDQIIEESRQHIIKKFGNGGYATEKMYFNDPEYQEFLKNIFILAINEEEFKRMYCKVNNIDINKIIRK